MCGQPVYQTREEWSRLYLGLDSMSTADGTTDNRASHLALLGRNYTSTIRTHWKLLTVLRAKRLPPMIDKILSRQRPTTIGTAWRNLLRITDYMIWCPIVNLEACPLNGLLTGSTHKVFRVPRRA